VCIGLASNLVIEKLGVGGERLERGGDWVAGRGIGARRGYRGRVSK